MAIIWRIQYTTNKQPNPSVPHTSHGATKRRKWLRGRQKREGRWFEHRRLVMERAEEWTKQANEWYRRHMIREEIIREEEWSACVKELGEGSRRNEKLIAKLSRKLKILNGEQVEIEQDEMARRKAAKKG